MIKSCLSLALALVIISCQNSSNEYLKLQGQAQGTTFNIQYRDIHQKDYSRQIDSLLRVIDKSLSLWDSTSILSRINRNEPGVQADSHFIKVFQKSVSIAEKTGGAFDFTVGPLVRAWNEAWKNGLTDLDSSVVGSLVKLTGYTKVRLDNRMIIKELPEITLDFNAIAQGYTVDVLSNFLQKKGINDFLVEIGGEVRAQGVNARDSLWVIGIEKPVEHTGAGRLLQRTIALHNESLATSGSYRKFIIRNGKKYSHIIDPLTGYPADHQMLSVSVKANDCMTADAYATAFLVLGMDKAFEKAQELQLEIYCIYAHENGTITIRSTPDFGK